MCALSESVGYGGFTVSISDFLMHSELYLNRENMNTTTFILFYTFCNLSIISYTHKRIRLRITVVINDPEKWQHRLF